MCLGRSVAVSLGRTCSFATTVAAMQRHQLVVLTPMRHLGRRPASAMMMVSVPSSTAQLRFYSSDKPSNNRRGKGGDVITPGVKKGTGTKGAKSLGVLSGHRNQTYAQNNLTKAKLAVKLAEGNVAEERLKVVCLKMVVAKGRILTAGEYVRLLGTTDRNTADYIRKATTIDPYTDKDAKQELKDAKQELEKAELKLKDAKQELKDVEKARLSAEIYYSEKTLLLDAKNTKHHWLFKVKGKALGGRTQLLKLLRQFLGRGIPSSRQKSYAFTLMGTNGVGKTHCSFLIGSSEFKTNPNELVVSAYCGVNNGWHLSDVERQYVRNELTLRDVMLTRVALALHHRANNLDTPWSSLRIKNTKILPRSQSIGIIVSAIEKIKQTKQAKRYVIFGVFDEIQELEEQFKNALNTTEGGVARIVFRILRELQVELATIPRVLFAGFGTGTLFRSKIDDATKGTNLVINEPFCDRETFLSLVGADTHLQSKIITRMIYPRARLIGEPQDQWLSYIAGVSEKDAQRLLPHALKQKSLPIEKFGGCVAFLGAQTSPTDRFMPLDDYILMVQCVRALTSFQCNPNHFVKNCDDFESWVGDALCAVLALATSAEAGPEVRKTVVKMNPWVNTVFGASAPTLESVRIVTPDNSKSNMLPFKGVGSLKNAIVRGVNNQIRKIVKSMEVDSLVMFQCKGSAPFDYVMIAKYQRPGGKLERRAALFDSKHSEKPNVSDTVAKQMKDKYNQVAGPLLAPFNDGGLLTKMTIAPPFLVTNRGVPKKTKGVEYITGNNLHLGGLSRAAFDSLDD